jgi:uncharacterized repeat protein (TIGR01451 family)
MALYAAPSYAAPPSFNVTTGAGFHSVIPKKTGNNPDPEYCGFTTNPSCVSLGYGSTIPTQARWGKAANDTQTHRSGIGFTNTTVTVIPGEPFLIGRLTHFNWPITHAAKQATMNLNLASPLFNTTIPVVIDIDETSNSGQVANCPYPSSTVCSDKLTWNAPGTTIVNTPSQQYLMISGLATSPDPNSPIVDHFISDENKQSHGWIHGLLTAMGDLAISKNHTGDFYLNQPNEYEITVHNLGPNTVYGPITVTDTLPAGMNYLGYTSDDFNCSAVGQDVTCTTGVSLLSTDSSSITLQVLPTTVAGSPVVNTASVSADLYEVDTDNNTAEDPTHILSSADLSIDKTHSPATLVEGGNVTWSMTIQNHGPSSHTGTITVIDTLPLGLDWDGVSPANWSCTEAGLVITCTNSAPLSMGSSRVLALRTTVLPSAANTVVNEASVLGTVHDPDTNNNTATDSALKTSLADLDITKSHIGNGVVGSTLEYTLNVTNQGPSAASGPITVVDTLPAGLTYESHSPTSWTCTGAGQVVTCIHPDNLAVGDSRELRLTVRVGAAAYPSVVNGAQVSSPTPDPDPDNSITGDPTTVLPRSDLSITKTHSGDYEQGSTGDYMITVTNESGVTNTGIQIVDTLPANLTYHSSSGSGWSCSAAGQVVTCGYASDLTEGESTTLTLTVNAVTAGNTVNHVVASGDITDPDTTNNEDTDPTTVTILPEADLSIDKESTGMFAVGSNGSYTLAVTNDGPANPGAITVTDTLPSGLSYVSSSGAGWSCSAAGQDITCERAAGLTVGSTSTVTLTVSISSGAFPSVVNEATVSSGMSDPDPTNNTDSVTTTVQPEVALGLNKQHVGSFVRGQTGEYLLTVTNYGSNTEDGPITVEDDLPPTLQYKSYSSTDPAWSCVNVGQNVTCQYTTPLAAGASTSFRLQVTPLIAGAIVNNARITGASTYTNLGGSQDSDPVTVLSNYDLGVTKGHIGDFTVGSSGTYTLTVTNYGLDTHTGMITLTDNLPAGLGYTGYTGAGWNCNLSGSDVVCTYPADLASGASASVDIHVSVGPSAYPSVTNTATVTSGAADSDLGNNSTTDPTTILPVVDLSLEKIHYGDFAQGVNGTYYLTVRNLGPITDPGPIRVIDTLPTGMSYVSHSGADWTCSSVGQVVTCDYTAALIPGASTTLSLEVSNSLPGSVVNEATVSTTMPDPDLGNNTATDPTVIDSLPRADLNLTKTHVGSMTVGETGTYLFTVANSGPDTAQGPIRVIDTLPAGLTYVSSTLPCSGVGQTITCEYASSLPAGGSFNFQIVVLVDDAAYPQVINNATVSSPTTDSDPANNDASDPTDIIRQRADLELVKTHVGAMYPGYNGRYTLTVINHGPHDAQSPVQVVDTLPTGMTLLGTFSPNWTCSQTGQDVTCEYANILASGSSTSLALDVSLDASMSGMVTNTATVSSPVDDPDLGNNTDTDDTTITPPPAPHADLGITKTSDGVLHPGTDETYTIVVTNYGPDVAFAPTQVVDTLPEGLTYNNNNPDCAADSNVVTCTINNDIAVGDSVTIQLTVHVDVAVSGSVRNFAVVSGSGIDPTPDNDSDDDTATVYVPRADLALDKAHNGNFIVGENGVYTLTVTNNGPDLAEDLVVTDTLPVGLTFVSAEGTTCSATGQVVTCLHPELLPGATLVIRLTVLVDSGAYPDVTNHARVDSSTQDPTPGNNDDSDLTQVTLPPSEADLSIIKSLQGKLVAGSSANYTLRVTNHGTADAAAPITVADTLPAGMTYSGHSGEGWSCSADGHMITCILSHPLAVSASSELTVSVKLSASAAGSMTNRAQISSPTPDPDPDNNTTQVTDPVKSEYDLSIDKSHSGKVELGKTLTYTLRIKNHGPSLSAKPITVRDTLPTSLSLVKITSGKGFTCTSKGRAIKCTHSNVLAPGKSALVRIQVRVITEGTITNTGTVSSPGNDTDLTNNTDKDTVHTPGTKDPSNPTPDSPTPGSDTPSTSKYLPHTGMDLLYIVLLGAGFIGVGFLARSGYSLQGAGITLPATTLQYLPWSIVCLGAVIATILDVGSADQRLVITAVWALVLVGATLLRKND